LLEVEKLKQGDVLNCYDDGKIRESREYKVVIKHVYTSQNAPEDIKHL